MMIPTTITYPYKFGNKTYNDGFELQRFINFSEAMGFLPQWEWHKLVKKDEWKNENGQKLSDIKILQDMEKKKPAKRKAASGAAKTDIKRELMIIAEIALNTDGLGELYQDTPVKYVEKVGTRVRTSACDFVIKVVAKKDSVERTESAFPATKANLVKNRIAASLVKNVSGAEYAKSGIVVTRDGKDLMFTVTKKTARVD